MSWLLDTNACVNFLNRNSEALVRRMGEAGPAQLAVSVITVAELEFGVAKSARVKSNADRLADLLAELHAEPFTTDCAATFGRLKANLKAAGKPISDFDMAIAATAMALGRTLVTDDAAFGRIKGLAVENWLAD